MWPVRSAGLLRGSFCSSGTGGSFSVFSRNDMGDDDQRLNRQAGTERSPDLRGGSGSPDSVLPSRFRLAASVDLERGKQPEKVLVFRRGRLLFPSVRHHNGGVFESAVITADSQENVRKNIEIRAVPGYTVSMFIVLRVREWTRRYDIL